MPLIWEGFFFFVWKQGNIERYVSQGPTRQENKKTLDGDGQRMLRSALTLQVVWAFLRKGWEERREEALCVFVAVRSREMTSVDGLWFFVRARSHNGPDGQTFFQLLFFFSIFLLSERSFVRRTLLFPPRSIPRASSTPVFLHPLHPFLHISAC